ncbi:MAG: hypothetical protein FWH27_02180 [Planctomycetaceae bacterium]|nr:hypothetical protein [Planctomycetaceae bacterium]
MTGFRVETALSGHSVTSLRSRLLFLVKSHGERYLLTADLIDAACKESQQVPYCHVGIGHCRR